MQSTPQLMPAGTEVTVPVPLPAGTTVKRMLLNVNVAVMVVAPFIVVTHEPVPEQPPPDQPVKLVLTPGVATRVTIVAAL